MINSIRKISTDVEQNTQRIVLLENALNKQVKVKENYENANYLFASGTTVDKAFTFFSQNATGCAVKIKISSEIENSFTVKVSYGGAVLKEEVTSLPKEYEFAILPVIGENTVTVNLKCGKYNYGAKIEFWVKGQLVGETSKRRLNVVSGNVVGFSDGDGYHLIDADNGQTVFSAYQIDSAKGLKNSDGNYTVIVEHKSGSTSIRTLDYATFIELERIKFEQKFSDCAVRQTSKGLYVYSYGGGVLKVFSVKNGEIEFLEKLAIKVKSIDYFKGESGEYFYFTDTKNNVLLYKLGEDELLPSKLVYSLGKKQNFVLSEQEGELIGFYKNGEVVAYLFLNEKTVEHALGVGVYGIQTSNGNSFLIKEDGSTFAHINN